MNVGSSRARSSNKIVANSKNAGNQGLTTQGSTPWTPERSVLVKSKSQIGKQTIFTGVQNLNARRVVDASPEPNAITISASGTSKVNTSSLSAKPNTSRQKSGTTVTLKVNATQGSTTQASHRSSSASYIKGTIPSASHA